MKRKKAISADESSGKTSGRSGQSAPSVRSTDQKNVLIITYYWPPSGGAGVQRFLKFVKYFRDYGINPVVLTCANPTYPIKDSSLADDIPEGTVVRYAHTVEPFGIYSLLTGSTPEKAANPTTILTGNKLNPLQRMVRWLRANLFVPDARLGWVLFARRQARKLIEEFAITEIVTTGPPHSTHFIGKWLKQKTGVRWIADFRDPWTDIHYNRALPRTAKTRQRDERMEIAVLKAADEVTVTAPGTGRYFSSKVDRTYHTIPNGFDPDDFSDQAQPDATICTPSSENSGSMIFTIRHIGTITETCIPFNLLRALSRLPATDFRMEFIGPVHPELQNQVSAHALEDRVRIISHVPHKQATTLMQSADLNVVVVHRSDDSRILIPGKLYDYFNARKPIMAIGPTDGDAAAIIRDCRIGKTFGYEDHKGPEDWIKTLAGKKTSPMDTDYGYEPDLQMINRYSRSELTRIFASILHSESNTGAQINAVGVSTFT